VSSGVTAGLFYSVLSVLMTWPIALRATRDVPGDLGDSLLNMWILAWGADHVPRLLTGGLGWNEFWNANIFHPEPMTLALSEHLFGQVLQILPIYWLTGNIILCYNLLFISTFALSALGMYLLVRDLTGDARAAFIAGLVYGFLPYRIAAIPHLQVMCSQWMPFALFGLNRFVTTGSGRALAGGTAALVMQNWSNGYYVLYFAPFVPLFVIHRMWAVGTLRNLRTWLLLIAAGAGTLVLTLPFLLPYQEAQGIFAIERVFNEVEQFAADVWSYATASEHLRIWGRLLRLYPSAEGETFLGLTAMLLAIAGIVAFVARMARESTASLAKVSPVVAWILIAAAATQVIALASLVLFGGFEFNLLGMPIRARTPERLLIQFGAAAAMLFVISPKSRDVLARLAPEPIAFFFVATVLAAWLSLGVAPKSGGTLLSNFGIYNWLYDWVPGFNGLRAPARYAMIAGLFLSVLAGYGARWLLTQVPSPKPQALFTVALATLILAEGTAVPMPRNLTWRMFQAMPPSHVLPYSELPPVYARVAALPAGTAITEFPFADPAWELRYVYYAGAHWKPITNGYSGGFPRSYRQLTARLARMATEPEVAWQSLVDSKTTHVILHRNAFLKAEDADTVENWLKAHGARELERFDDNDILLSLN
jgi:hypothetical protein